MVTEPKKGSSYDVTCTPWQDAVGTVKPRWEWLEETTKVQALQNGLNGSNQGPSPYPGAFGTVLREAMQNRNSEDEVARPEHKIFGLAMLGGGRVFGEAHLHGAIDILPPFRTACS